MLRFAFPGMAIVAALLGLMYVSSVPPVTLPDNMAAAPLRWPGPDPQDVIVTPKRPTEPSGTGREQAPPPATSTWLPQTVIVVPHPPATALDLGSLQHPRSEPQPREPSQPARAYGLALRPMRRPGNPVPLAVPRELSGLRGFPSPVRQAPNTLSPQTLPEPARAPARPQPLDAFKRLRGARVALAANNLEAARLQLELAQTQIVFQPIGSDLPGASRWGTRVTSQIADALGSLTHGDRPSALRHIDLAIASTGG